MRVITPGDVDSGRVAFPGKLKKQPGAGPFGQSAGLMSDLGLENMVFQMKNSGRTRFLFL